MNDIWMSKKESPLLGLQGMGGGVGGFNFLSAAGEGGGLWAWGVNKNWLIFQAPAPQTPANAATARSSPVSVFGTKTDWTHMKICTQAQTYNAMDKDGNLYVWGSNSYGALGQSQKQPQHPGPRDLAADCQLPGTWRQVASCMGTSFAVKDTDDGLFAWGVNRHGVMGNNQPHEGGARSSPSRIPGTWAAATIGGNDQDMSGMGVKTDGTLWMWGKDPKGKLGIPGGGPYPHEPETAPRYSSPIQVGTDTNWGKDKFLIDTGDEFSMAIKTDGTLWAWGANQYGSLGLNYHASRSSPTQVGTSSNWSQILVGGDGYRAYGVKSDNTLWAWGAQEYWGLLGLNQVADPASFNNRSSPTQIPGSWKIGGSTNAGRSNMGWVKEDGTLWRWGANNYGEMGTNDQGPSNPENPGPWTSRSSPIQVGSGTDWLGTTGDYEMVGAWGAK